MFAHILAETRQRGNSDVTNLVAHKILSMGEAWSGEELKFQDRRLQLDPMSLAKHVDHFLRHIYRPDPFGFRLHGRVPFGD